MDGSLLEFVNGELPQNALMVEGFLGLESEADVPVLSFEIFNDGQSTGLIEVGPGKYKSAMFLLYLEKMNVTDPDEIRRLTRAFFGDDLMDHPTPTALSHEGDITFTINHK